MADRLGEASTELRTRIEVDPSLDDLTRTPFILSEVASLFEAGSGIPSTKMGVLARVIHLQEQQEEHRNSLQDAPIYDGQADYLNALATTMTSRGAVALTETDARAAVATVAKKLRGRGQIGQAEPAEILGKLVAHHLLERVEYPDTLLQFEHQQFQEHYAALDVRAGLLDLPDDDQDQIGQFAATYVNNSGWAEPLRMIAGAFAERSGIEQEDELNIRAGVQLVNMALCVDLVFAGELARLCGSAIWKKVRTSVGERLRAVHNMSDRNYRQYAVAAMLATGSDDFSDITLPLLSGQDRQTRLETYRLWPDIQLPSLGPDWRATVRCWSEEARTDFVSELLHYRIDEDVVAFAVEDDCIAVKKAAVSGLTWIGAEDALTRVIESMDVQTFEDQAVTNPDHIPMVLRPKAVSAMRRLVGDRVDNSVRFRTALKLIELGESGLEDAIKKAMEAFPIGDRQRLHLHFFRPALVMLHDLDPVWTGRWVVSRIAKGVLQGDEEWLPFATVIPDEFVEEWLHRLETTSLGNLCRRGMKSVFAARADEEVARRVFAKLRDLRRKVEATPSDRNELEWEIVSQLEATFRSFPDDLVATGVLLSAESGNPLDIKIAARLLSTVARPDQEPLRIADADLKARLGAFLKSSVNLVLSQDDYEGTEKADLASSIAQIGDPEDMADLERLIRADIERMRGGRAAILAGDRGPRGNGGMVTYARWNVAAAAQLDRSGSEKLLIELLSEPEYSLEAAFEMARDFLPESGHSLIPEFPYDLMWSAREGRIFPPGGGQRRSRLATALNAEIRRRRLHATDEDSAAGVKELAMALAAIDGRGSAQTVLEAIALPGRWARYSDLDSVKRLLTAGVAPPARTVFGLLDSVLERMEDWMQDSDWHLVFELLALCPFVDDPSAGIAKMREVIADLRIRQYRLREIVTALGESRTDSAVDLLSELASDRQTFEQCEDNFINAFAALDASQCGKVLLSLVDPDMDSITMVHRPRHEDLLVERLVEQAKRRPKVATRLRDVCELDLPEFNRNVLSRVMCELATRGSLVANLKLIDDEKPSPVPRGVWVQLEDAFVMRKPHRLYQNAFTLHARASNELRAQLHKMVFEDRKRQKSAFKILGQIEVWRLEYGRPADESRNPDLSSGRPWPPGDVGLFHDPIRQT